MVIRISFVIALFGLLFSCAQVQVLTGGEKDATAPRLVNEKCQPQNASLFFDGKEITLTFDEFLTLNNVQESVIMVPPHAKPKLKLKKKTVTVNWDEDLQPNTTYALYFNGTFQDITEKNDSLYTYVFSTGSEIDSLSYSTIVSDAYLNSPSNNFVVGLYLDSSTVHSERPVYFGKTNRQGMANLSYLKTGKYFLLAFEDVNRDLICQEYEQQAFHSEFIQLDGEANDSLVLKSFSPNGKPALTSLELFQPGMISIAANFPLVDQKMTINGKAIDEKTIQFPQKDSALILLPVSEMDSVEVQLFYGSDTLTKTRQIRKSKTKKPLVSNVHLTEKNTLFPGDTLKISYSDRIQSVDTSQISFYNTTDSSFLAYTYSILENSIAFYLDKPTSATVHFNLKASAVQSKQGFVSDSLFLNLNSKIEKDLGIINLSFENYTTPIVLLVKRGSQVLRTLPLGNISNYQLTNLIPGEYSFAVILDENNNGKWDTGNTSIKQQPEEIHWYSQTTKVRANWEMEVLLEPLTK